MTVSPKDLQRVSYIWYPDKLQKQQIQDLIDFGSEINTITHEFAARLGFSTQPVYVHM